MTKSLSCTVTPQIAEAIERLLWGGLHGNTRAEVARRLVSDAILRVIKEGYLKMEDITEPHKGAI